MSKNYYMNLHWEEFEEKGKTRGVGTYRWVGTYIMSEDELGMYRDHVRRRHNERFHEDLDKMFISFIESQEGNRYVTRNATKRTMIMHPKEYPAFLQDQINLDVPAQTFYDISDKELKGEIGWRRFTIEKELINEMLQAVGDLYSRTFYNNAIIIVPISKFSKGDEDIERLLSAYDGGKLFDACGFPVYISSQIEKVIALQGEDKR